MTLRKIGWLLSLCSLAMVGCQTGGKTAAQKKAPEAAAAKPTPAQPAAAKPAPAPAKPAVDPVKEVGAACTALVAAAGDEAKLASLSTAGLKEALATPAAKRGMTESLKNAKCGTPKVQDTKATVPVTAGKKTRDIPFVKEGDMWKFDVAAYTAKYPAPKAEKGKKKGKRGKHHRRPHHRKHK